MPKKTAPRISAGYLQFRPQFGKVEQNTSRLLELLHPHRADLIVLPELCLTGYNFRDRAELERYAVAPSRSDSVKALRALCAKKDMHLVLGLAERAGDQIFNTALLIGPRGIALTYRKLHLFMREKEIFDPGDRPLAVRNVKGVRVGLMICWDWAVPEAARTLALRGADLIAHPSNLVLDYCQRAMFARCVENGVYAITANRCGADRRPHGTIRFTGRSQIVGPRGELVQRAGMRREELHVEGIDAGRARDKMITPYNHTLQDRRPEFYA